MEFENHKQSSPDIEQDLDETDQRFNRFKNFEVLPRPPADHRFKMRGSWMPTEFSFRNKISKEWKNLESNLPSSIYVRAYNSRVDLMRAYVAGLEGTPYCHNLFFFDIYIPRNYPLKALEILYHQNLYGFDMNPNLEKDGRVSFDRLLDNANGSINNSSVLNLLLSIQHHVLGNGEQCLGLTSKVDVFKLSCRAMIVSLKKERSQEIRDFVRGHFRRRSYAILQIYKEEVLSRDGSRAAMDLFFRLVESFEANGSYCKHLYKEEEMEEFKMGPQEDDVQDKYVSFFANVKSKLLCDIS